MGLTNSSNLSDLARIEINVPVSVDEEWQTDVKKSSLQLPPLIKAKLRNLIKLPKKNQEEGTNIEAQKKKKTPIGQELKMTEKILFHMKLVMKTMN